MNTNIDPGLDVLNVGHGHLEIRFNNHDTKETERAQKIVTDMLQRGFAIFVDLGSEKGLHRVKAFDAAENAYIINDSPDIPADSVAAAPSPKPKARAGCQSPKSGPRLWAGVREVEMETIELKPVAMKMAKAPMDEWEKVMTFVQELEKQISHRCWSDEVKTDEELGKWVRANMPPLMRTVYGYRVLVDNCCDPAVDYLAFKPELAALMKPKEPAPC